MMNKVLLAATRVAALFIATVSAATAEGLFSEERFEEAPWEEVAKTLPALPSDQALIPVVGSPAAAFRFGIDPASISVGVDGVVRYTLVATSRSGVRNVAYEGMRCATRERRIYAVGVGSEWHRAQNANWQPIVANRSTTAQAELYANAFCDGKNNWGTAEQLVQRARTVNQRTGPQTIYR